MNETSCKDINPSKLYEYSIFFRNYIQNVADDVLKNGIQLESLESAYDEDILGELKVDLKDALYNCVISQRFYGVGYILILTATDFDDYILEVNNELPTGFMYLEFDRVRDLGRDNDYIEYSYRRYKPNSIKYTDTITIHKSRIIIYGNYNAVLKAYTPVYTQSLLLDIYLLEKIYKEIQKRMPSHNFIFYKDEALSEIHQSIRASSAQMGLKDKLKSGIDCLFAKMVKNADLSNIQDEDKPYYQLMQNKLSQQFEELQPILDNSGFFFSSTPDSSMEVIKYDLAYLKDSFELVKAKLGADTKEPLTRLFNEQTKGLGNDGKGDRSNYYDFLKSIQETIEIQSNLKLNKYYGLDIRFNSLIILDEIEKIEHDVKLLEFYKQYIQLANEIPKKGMKNVQEKLYFSDSFVNFEDLQMNRNREVINNDRWY